MSRITMKPDIQHKDFRLWIEKYGWTPDPKIKNAGCNRNRRIKSARRFHRKERCLLPDCTHAVYPRLASKASSMCLSAKKRAELMKLPFDLTPEWVLSKLIEGRCEATGIAFDLGYNSGADDKVPSRRMFAPSLDQIKPSCGYTKDNVQVVVWCYNGAKSTGTDDDVLIMARALVAKKGM